MGAYGLWVVRDQSYTHGPDMRIVRDLTTVTGPEAVRWGWTLVAGAASAMAWALFALIESAKARTVFAAIATATMFSVLGLQSPPLSELQKGGLATAFYVSCAFWLVGALLWLLVWVGLEGRGLRLWGALAAIGAGLVCFTWGFDGLHVVTCRPMSDPSVRESVSIERVDSLRDVHHRSARLVRPPWETRLSISL